ncbi:MAG: hypothetical protein MK081_10035 [Flavobacteriales bacterium]|nr:hypothetical protein [Flavobacteriales bacterium]
MYDSNGFSLPNANFIRNCVSSILCPVPGDDEKYYFVRSNGTSGLDYLTIDISSSCLGRTQTREFEGALTLKR